MSDPIAEKILDAGGTIVHSEKQLLDALDAPVLARKLTTEEWKAIEDACCDAANPLTYTEAEAKFGISRKTISKRALRHKWPVPRHIAKAVTAKLETAIEKAAENIATRWVEKGERHREVVFDLAHESLKKMKPKAPKNFREAEAADKMARRAAGLEVADMTQQTLIQINEAIDAHVTPVEGDVVEAEVVETAGPEEPAEIEGSV